MKVLNFPTQTNATDVVAGNHLEFNTHDSTTI